MALWDLSDIQENTCVSEKLSTWGQQYCIRKDGEYIQNAGNKAKTVEDTVNTLLCVEFDNSPFQGRFYPLVEDNQVDVDTVVAMEALVTDYVDTYTAAKNEPADSFTTGEKMISYLKEKTQLGNIWPIPGPDGNGECSDMNPARWLVGKEYDECKRSFTLCTDPSLDPATYASSLRIASTPSLTLSLQNQVPVIVRTLSLIQPSGKIEVLATNTTGTPYGTNCQCSGIVREVQYWVVTDAESSQLISVFANMYIGMTNQCTVKQKFSLEFRSNSVFRKRSGNPGYLPGRPVLFLATSSSVDLVTHTLGGVNSDGSCSSDSSGFYLATSPVVSFRSEMLYTCSLSFTYTQLQQYCKSATPNSEIPFFALTSLPQYVAMFGNADPSNIDDFLQINITNAYPDVWDENMGACNLTNTLVIEFVTAEIGAQSNPQPKIIAARVYFKPGT